jgi:integrase
MARTQRDSKIDTRTARLRLAPQKEPYWRVMEEGKALGYRRLDGGKPGTWTARLGTKEAGKVRYGYRSLANADDYGDSDGVAVQTFAQAQQTAREWFQEIALAGWQVIRPLTVKDAIDLYMADYVARSDRATPDTWLTINSDILPIFGTRLVKELKAEEITAWRNKLVTRPARRRKSKDGKPPLRENVKAAAALAAKRPPVEPSEARRKRQASVNRILTVLKAILNHAFKIRKVESDLAWRTVSPFKNVDQPRIRYLSDDESKRLVAACAPDFREIVIAALLTGADYGELRTARLNGIDTEVRTLTVSKKRGTHTIALTKEAARHFAILAQGKASNDLLMTQEDGQPWGKSYQVRRMSLACEAASIVPGINYHVLRHTFATRALRKGAPMHYVSHQLGHKNIRTTQKHYAHVIPSDAAEAIEKAMGDFGFV